MNRIDRLFGILLRLQGREVIRAQDLADAFEVTLRTIYRDMSALSELGVPVVPLPGEGYTLAEGFYLPPLLFTENEAMALLLGARMLATNATGHLPDDAERAILKIAAVLPAPLREEVEELSEMIDFWADEPGFDLDDERLTQFRRAIREYRPVFIRYHSRNDEQTERVIEPRDLLYNNGAWYVSAYCRLRQGERNFRLDRIDTLRILKETFEPRDAVEIALPEMIEVRVAFDANVYRWVGERQHYGFQWDDDLSDGRAVGVYHVQHVSEIKAWVLGWGAAAEVLSPQTLRDEIRTDVETLLKRLT